MGRRLQSREAVRDASIHLIRTAQELIMRNGVDSVSIRTVAAKGGINSAVLYRYFRDLDELILFACVAPLQSYCRELMLEEERLRQSTPAEIYLAVWELFCRAAFRQPDCIRHLFFGRHSGRLDHVIRAYYDLFPEQLGGVSGELLAMLRSGCLAERNRNLLRPVFDGRLPEEELSIINDITISFFQNLLEEKIAGGEEAKDEELTERMLRACRFLLRVEAE